MKKPRLLFLLILCLAVSHALGAEDQEVRETIEAAEQKWLEAFNSHDGDALADLYASDAQSLQPDIGILKGQEAIRKHFKEAAQQERELSQTVVTLDVFAQGDLATETGTWSVKNEDESMVEDGTYMMVWQKKGDDWKVLREIWNTTSKKIKLIEGLQPVERLLGSWVADMEMDGGKLHVSATYKAAASGTEINGEGSAWFDGKMIDQWSEHLYYKPDTKSISDLSVSKAEGYSLATVETRDDTLVFQENGVDHEGAAYVRVTELTFEDKKMRASQPWGMKAGKSMENLLKNVEIKRAD